MNNKMPLDVVLPELKRYGSQADAAAGAGTQGIRVLAIPLREVENDIRGSITLETFFNTTPEGDKKRVR
jgi:hypothetical protein